MSSDMRPMDHAAAHERIEDLLLDPRRLADLEASTAPDDVALREHVAGCAACRADLEGWRALEAAIASSLPRSTDEALAVTEPTELPPSLRATVLAGARSEQKASSSIALAVPRRSGGPSRLAPLLAMAAALILVVGSAWVVVDQANRRAAAEAENAALTSVLAAVDRVLASPGHVVVQLHQPDGTNAGSISWSRHDWVVITNALARPAAGSTYLCWLVEGDAAQRIGTMQFAGTTAFWVASVDKWATWEIKPTTKFIVTLHPDCGQQPQGPTLLEAALGA
jgi:hypothetical protein